MNSPSLKKKIRNVRCRSAESFPGLKKPETLSEIKDYIAEREKTNALYKDFTDAELQRYYDWNFREIHHNCITHSCSLSFELTEFLLFIHYRNVNTLKS